MTIYDLPAVNGSLNALSTIFLSAGYVFIKRKNMNAHRNCMIAAFVTSTLFLACYLTYHIYLGYVLHRGPTVFVNPAWFRPIYLAILIHPPDPGDGDCAADFHDPEPRLKSSDSTGTKKSPAGPGRCGCMCP